MNKLENETLTNTKTWLKANVLTVILALMLLAASITAYVYYRKSKSAETKVTSGQQIVNQAAKIIDHYVDSSGRSHAVINASDNVLPANWYKNGTAISGGLVDTVAKALKIAKDKLQEVTQVATVSQANALKAQQTIDSLKRITYFYKDKYLQLAYHPPVNASDPTDHGLFDYKYNDSLNVVQYWKKNWILGAKKSYIDIFSSDPRTTINGVKRLVVQQQEPTFGLRVQGVGNYSFSRHLLNIGPGLQFDMGRFSLIGTYYFDFDANQFRPSLGARYDLIRF